MFNHEIIFFIEALLADEGQSVRDIARKHNMSRKKLWYEMNQLNGALSTVKAPTFKLADGQLVIPQTFKEQWPDVKQSLSRREVFIKEERLYVMILYVFIRREEVSGHHFQDLLQLSKNSVLEEVKKLKAYAKDYHLDFQYSRQKGYHFVGDERHIRQLAEHGISQLLQLSTGEWALELVFSMWQKKLNIEEIHRELQRLTKPFRVNFVEERLLEILYLLAFIKEEEVKETLSYPQQTLMEIMNQPLYQIGQVIAGEFSMVKNVEEATFITIRLLGALQGNSHLVDNCGLGEINSQVIQRVQALMGTQFVSLSSIEESLFEHLVPAYFRIVYDIALESPYTAQIKSQYEELFYLVAKGLEPFANFLGKPIPENEVAYFTIHFGGQLERLKTEQQPLRALAICPNGISSSLILTSNLKEIFPMITFHRVHQLDLVQDIAVEDYDMIFSTTYYQTAKKLYITKPILNYVEVQMLKSKVLRDFDLSNYTRELSVYDILEVVAKHGVITNEKALFEELSARMFGTNLSLNEGGKTLTELLSKEFITLTDQHYNWKEAIAKATEPLLSKGYVTPDYIDAMIASTEKTGPYIVLAPKVAVPHARPEEGVNQLGISLLRLSQPVDFNLNEPYDEERLVQLIFVLAAVDNVSHLTALKQLSQILEEESTIEALIAATSIEELYDTINNYL